MQIREGLKPGPRRHYGRAARALHAVHGPIASPQRALKCSILAHDTKPTVCVHKASTNTQYPGLTFLPSVSVKPASPCPSWCYALVLLRIAARGKCKQSKGSIRRVSDRPVASLPPARHVQGDRCSLEWLLRTHASSAGMPALLILQEPQKGLPDDYNTKTS